MIHPTAIIEDGATVGAEVRIGAYAYIGGGVELGHGCIIGHHATVEGRTRMGPRNEVFPYAFIGGKTHDLKFDGGTTGLRIGEGNTFREYVTVHCATADGDATVLGNHNTILAYSHIAHDCHIGDHLIMSSHAALGGHVELGDHVNIGWGVGVHQFVRIGDDAMIGACSKAVQDIPPYMLADGNPAAVRFVNKVGLQRHGFDEVTIEHARTLFKHLYKNGLNRAQALEALEALGAASPNPMTAKVIAFVASTERGLA